ncbi:MAG: tyrosine-type recombinase/integrase [Acidobacteria bacterium]|nr:tyrosine-type recombinase/integrase [Acidobacteriota bacterium]
MWTENQKQKLELLRGRFIEYLMAVNYSPATLVNYSRDAGIFLDWLTENTALNSIADVTAASFAVSDLTLPPRNRRRKNRTKKAETFCRSTGQQTGGDEAVLSLAVAGRRDRSQPVRFDPDAEAAEDAPRNILTPAEAKRLIESIPIEKARDIRDRSILEVMYATGIRRAELVSLTIYDVEMQTGTLRIEHGKGNETRLVPLTQSSQTALKLYLEQARTAFASQPGQIRLFVSSRSGGPLDVDDIRRIVRKWTKNANIKRTSRRTR